jgi:hypothetical protein
MNCGTLELQVPVYATINKDSGERISEVQIWFCGGRGVQIEKRRHIFLLKSEMNFKVGTVFVFHRSKVSTFSGVWCVQIENCRHRMGSVFYFFLL